MWEARSWRWRHRLLFFDEHPTVKHSRSGQEKLDFPLCVLDAISELLVLVGGEQLFCIRFALRCLEIHLFFVR